MSNDSHETRLLLLDYLVENLRKEKISVDFTKKLFLRGLNDFLKGNIDPYEFEALSSLLFYEIQSPDEIVKKDPDLGLVLDISSDIVFYFKKNKSRYDEILEQLKKYLAGSDL